MNDDVSYFVLNENTLGLVRASNTDLFEVLHGSILRGSTHDWKNGPVPISSLDTLRPATKEDFDAYRVCWKGHLPE